MLNLLALQPYQKVSNFTFLLIKSEEPKLLRIPEQGGSGQRGGNSGGGSQSGTQQGGQTQSQPATQK